ncbi:hypothetical protein F443_14745, partial [Phytophthora nicotianae P1569]
METPPPSTSFRPPDEIVPDSQSSDNESQESMSRVRLYDEIVPDSQESTSPDNFSPPRKLLRRRRAAWSVLRARLRDVMQQMRVLIFVHTSDPKLCLDIRLCAVMRWKKIGWMALLRTSDARASDLETNLQLLQTFTKEDLLQDNNIDSMLACIAAHVLCGHVREYRPLLAKLSAQRFQKLNEVFD